ncbi:hypothetical protein KUTeg_005062 [Tegillarca granosa]|uniref:Uncharacterized protein n=1 Tax=Tegillarca granosa TaxID=220873 RepID=A0ABQ9FN85_TEGGR|nr:hypothetical protein KUTeg_005062 [Tegillarca granosa]
MSCRLGPCEPYMSCRQGLCAPYMSCRQGPCALYMSCRQGPCAPNMSVRQGPCKQQQHSEYSGPVPLMDSFNAFNQSPGMWPTQMSQQQSMMGDYQTMMNYPMAMALNQQQYQYGMPPQMFPFMQQTAWSNNFMYPPPQIGLPGQQFPNVPASSDGTPTQSQYGTPGSLSQSSTVAASPSVTMTPAAVETTTPPNPSLPPLPPSPSTPPPPGTEDIPIPLPMPKKDLTKSLKEAKSQSEVIEEEVVEEVSQEDMLEDIPLPPIMPPDKKMDSEEVIEETETVEMSEDQIVTTEDDSTQDSTTKRPYQFAWDREVDVDEMSEVTVSSVHTSDLSRSEFEDDESDLELSSDSDTNQEGPPDLTETEAETSMEVVSQDDAETAESLPSSQDEMPTLKPAGSDASAEIEPVPGQESQVVVSQEISPPKPRKLISLQYNYSDSDDEETREEKKARVAKEKEERYLKRLQRRAELEAKRKEREEEKARMKEERKKAKEKAKDETQKEDKGSEDNKEEKDSQDEEKLSQPSDSPEKKKRKTKAELKEELIKQKLEKKLALRRQRTRTRRYTSEEFESIFTDEKKQPFSSQSYSEVVVEEGTVEETVETDFIVSMTLDVATEEVTEQSKIPPSPPTPTMDEKYEDSEEVSIPASEHSSCIPIYEVPTGTAISAINVSIPHTRTHTKNTDDTKSNSSGRPGTPLSDISDTSKSGSEQKGVKRKRQDSGTSRSEEKNSSKRYDTSDLYPPRHSFASNRRRASSPITTETSLSSRSDTNASQPEKYSKITGGPASPIIIDDKSSRASSPSCKPSPISSSSLSPDHSQFKIQVKIEAFKVKVKIKAQ